MVIIPGRRIKSLYSFKHALSDPSSFFTFVVAVVDLAFCTRLASSFSPRSSLISLCNSLNTAWLVLSFSGRAADVSDSNFMGGCGIDSEDCSFSGLFLELATTCDVFTTFKAGI